MFVFSPGSLWKGLSTRKADLIYASCVSKWIMSSFVDLNLAPRQQMLEKSFKDVASQTGLRSMGRGARNVLICLSACRDHVLGGLWTGIRPTQITIASKMVKDFTGVMVQPHKVMKLLALIP